MIKVAMIGAGSVVFARNMTGDILSYPEFRNATITYMDIDRERLEVAGLLGRKMAAAVGANPTILTTMDRREALRGADFVINMVQIGGFDSTLVDFEIPRKYGLNFTIADTTGPGGVFRALRTYPMLKGLARDMQEVCPRAYLLNYSNPMDMNMQTVFRNGLDRAVGLCHSVQGTFNQLMRYLGEDPAQVAFTCAGINHMAFYLKIEKDGVDLYPRIFAAMKDEKIRRTNKVRFELMRMLGHFVTESSEHSAEYCSYFIPHGEARIRDYDVPIDEYLRRCDGIVDEFERLKVFARGPEPLTGVKRSHEYGSTIIHSIATGAPAVVYGNMPNRGCIDNLPREAIVEAPTLVDRTGLHFAQVGALPPQLAAYMQPHIAQRELFIRAAMEERRDHLYQACMFDPLTAATLTTDQMVAMCDELIAAHGPLLPPLPAKGLVPTSGTEFPPVDARALRASWDKAQEESGRGCISDWKLIGPFPAEAPQRLSVRTPFPVEASMRGDGGVDLAVGYDAPAATGSAATATAVKLAWKDVGLMRGVDKRGRVNLGKVLGQREFCAAYAYHEWEEIHAGREAVLSCGSDDAIRIWLNGELVHDHEVRRGLTPDQDQVTVRLREGVNRLLVKIVNYENGWGFQVRIPPATF